MKENNPLFEAAHALMLLVEGPGCLRWEDGNGSRLKDTSEWATFYCAVKTAPPAEPVESLGRDADAADLADRLVNGHTSAWMAGDKVSAEVAAHSRQYCKQAMVDAANLIEQIISKPGEPPASVPDGKELTIHDMPEGIREQVLILRRLLAGSEDGWAALCAVMRHIAKDEKAPSDKRFYLHNATTQEGAGP